IQSSLAAARREASVTSGIRRRPALAKRGEQRAEIGGQWSFPLHRRPRQRMHEPKTPRVKRLTTECDRVLAPVRGVADERMTQRRQMNAYLVRAPGFQSAREERAVAEAFSNLEAGQRGLARGHDRHRRPL